MTTALRRQQNSAASCSDLATKATPYSAPEKISDSPTPGIVHRLHADEEDDSLARASQGNGAGGCPDCCGHSYTSASPVQDRSLLRRMGDPPHGAELSLPTRSRSKHPTEIAP
jgi:hypothetical protein